MTQLDKVRDFLSKANSISLGSNEIIFIQLDHLEEEQIGYSADSEGNSLLTGSEGDWQEEWLVIATDQLGDPIIVDVSSPELTVLSAANGEGSWEPIIISDSLEHFQAIVSTLVDISDNRSNPVAIENNPLTDGEKQKVLFCIEAQNPNSEIWFWETFLEIE